MRLNRWLGRFAQLESPTTVDIIAICLVLAAIGFGAFKAADPSYPWPEAMPAVFVDVRGLIGARAVDTQDRPRPSREAYGPAADGDPAVRTGKRASASQRAVLP